MDRRWFALDRPSEIEPEVNPRLALEFINRDPNTIVILGANFARARRGIDLWPAAESFMLQIGLGLFRIEWVGVTRQPGEIFVALAGDLVSR